MTFRSALSFLLALFLVSAAPAARADNPFGLMLWPGGGQDLSMLAARAAGLGVGWFRPPTVSTDRWPGPVPCPSCAALAQSDLHLVLTVRNGGGAAGLPPTPPTDLDRYERSLAAILDAWKPAVVVVENEEDRLGRGDIALYARELTAACDLAHRRGMACANGGLSSDAVTGLTWLDLLERGQPELACRFARKAVYDQADPRAGERLCAYHGATEVPAALRAALVHGADRLLSVYRSAPIDAVNFHWYGHDAAALAMAADSLARAVGKPVMSNEIGQRRWEADPTAVRPLLRAAVAAGVRPAIWYSLDTPATVSLFNDDGSLRPAGREFALQMSGRK